MVIPTDQACIVEMVSVEGALEYWRRGEFNEALAVIRTAKHGDRDPVSLCQKICLEAMVLVDMGELVEAWNLVASDCPASIPHVIKGKYYGTRGHVLSRLGRIEASIENHVAAQCWFDLAGHKRHHASSKANLARLYAEVGDFETAHRNLDYADALFRRLNENDALGQAEDQRASVYLRQGILDKAERAARAAVTLLKNSEHVTWLAEAQTTLGAILARTNRSKEAVKLFDQAMRQCELVEAKAGIALTAITMIEELTLTKDEMLTLLAKAEGFWDTRRVLKARKVVIGKLLESYEIEITRCALQKHAGSVTKAAKELGLKSHGSVINLIVKHPELSSFRKPKRKKSITRK